MLGTTNTRNNAAASSSRVQLPDTSTQTHGSGSVPTSPTSTPTTRITAGGPGGRGPAPVGTRQSQGPRGTGFKAMVGRLTGATQAAEAKAAAAAKAEDAAQRATFARAVATIDLDAMRQNFRLGMAVIGAGVLPDPDKPGAWLPATVRPAAVVKADGYGLDAGKVALTLASEGCRDFFVASTWEAADLRAAFKAERPDLEKHIAINMLDGVTPDENLQYLVNHKITPALNSVGELALWNAKGEELGKPLPTILQFDSGMARAGIREHQREQVLKDLKDGKYPFLDVKLVMTHLSDSDDATRVPLHADATPAEIAEDKQTYNHTPGAKTRAQLKSFDAVCDDLRKIYPQVQASIGASSTVFIGKDPSQSIDLHKDMVRMGATFHGQAPFSDENHPLKPTLDIKAKVRQVEEAKPGEVVGYGSRYKVDGEDEDHAAIAWGYTEGAPRRPNGNKDTKAHVLLGDGPDAAEAPFIGATSMDQSQIKLPEGSAVKPGDMVTVLGGKLTVNEFSRLHGSGVSELGVKLGSRVDKRYKDENAPSPIGEAFVDPSPHAWKD